MGLRPTRRHESPTLASTDSKWVIRDFRRSANANVRYFRLQKNVARPPELLRRVTRTLMPERLRSRVRQTILGANLVTRPGAPMDPAFRRHLQKELEPQIEQLSKLLDLDLTSWGVD